MPARQKKPPLRSESYKAYIRGLPCDDCGAAPPNQCHHHGTWGMGVKTDDFRANALCLACHNQYHASGTLPPSDHDETHGFLISKALDHLIDWIREEWD